MRLWRKWLGYRAAGRLVGLLAWGPVLGSAAALLHVPNGFVVEKAAGDPDIAYPMFACYDDAGRLYVAESSGLDLYEELRRQTRRCRVSRLEDRDGDGVFERSRVFVDELVFPMGLAWRQDRLYVADPPDLVTFTDTDDDGRADRREVILSGFGHTDNGSLHGVTFGPDGWLYLTMGQPDGYRLRRGDGTFLTGKSGALLRCRPDGSGIETVSRGFENLVEIIFLPDGEIIGTDNWYQLPEAGVRDALVHLVEGGVYPLNAHPGAEKHFFNSGESLPPVRLYPAVALSGLARCRSASFPASYRDNAFSAQFNTRKVARHRFVRTGATFRTVDEDFLTTDNPDFHPSDVLESPDGSLLVVDTGSWYVQHCPTGRIRRAPARGGLYRVRYEPGHAAQADGDDAANREAEAALWALGRSGGDVYEKLNDPSLRVLAARVLARFPDARAFDVLGAMLKDARAHYRLAAAEALAHGPNDEDVDLLWDALVEEESAGGEKDPFVRHALLHAIFQRAGTESLLAALADERPSVRRAALVLLDQAPHRALQPEHLLASLGATHDALRDTALSILQDHPEWSEIGVMTVTHLWNEPSSRMERDAGLVNLTLAFADHPGVQAVLAGAVSDASKPSWIRRDALAVMIRYGEADFPKLWTEALSRVLAEGELGWRLEAARLAWSRDLSALQAQLRGMADDGHTPPDLRLEAVRARLAGDARLSPSIFAFLLKMLDSGENVSRRLAAAELLGRSDWADNEKDPRDLMAVIGNDRLVSPATLLPLLVRAEGEGFWRVFTYLSERIRDGWQPSEEQMRLLGDRVPRAGHAAMDELRTFVEQRRARQVAQVESFLRYLTGGDPARGRRVFTDRAACSACHRVDGDGGVLGPDLTKIGAIRSGRDLVESVVFPSATFAQGYETWAVTLSNGDALTGLRVRGFGETLVLRDAAGAEQVLPPDRVEEITRRSVSLMPEGLLGGLSETEIQDLFAYLLHLQ